ncbi:uncharacterized protein PGTG_03401 [Puccinia graminis f. sp. tritici CRL 75-36-700-3]|uniref:RING-type domain-containing protein n=1 Tax=Puccinia graminis f. sp. tritici (strain CRL 75-36-700-3 / race SCCL) TaxID=418459 RepID=E3JZH0_PUCGT|nr:uncharacterized protein PGTG_03401 [Puccinia graminis f. sp. tritici CRL 75-36-700-3]EFP77445.1 hypothetical protein PGTG_03401 [Puccinia graminis f. sp. tritici CRL 75-36-700-3]
MINHPANSSSKNNHSSPNQHQLNFKPTRLSQNQRRANDQQTFSHLLGFTLPPRSAQSNQSSSSTRRPARKQHAHTSYYDKDRFVHAKYRFILKPTGDYTVHFADPDIRFNWPDILQVIVNHSTHLHTVSNHPQTSDLDPDLPFEKHACPICLSEPTAARMTKCGHIFCYPCILHYLELSDDGKAQGRKCPVCYETILKKDLKSVKWFDCSPEQAGDHPDPVSDLMTFRLIERPNFTTLALPRSTTWLSSAVPTHHSPWQFTPDALTFAKFMLASPDYMTTELNKDLEELHSERLLLSKWSSSQDGSEDLGIVFIRAAEAKVREQIEKVGLLKTTFVMTEKKQAKWKIDQAVEEANRGLDSANQLQISTTTDEEELTPIPATVESLIPQSLDQPAFLPNQREHTLLISPGDFNNNNTHDDVPKAPESRLVQSDFVSSTAPKPRKNVNPPEPTSTTYRFYQAASGEQIYLSALDIRVLLTKFGSFDCFPSSITLKVEGWSEVRVSDDLRRRCRYLSHLPTGSEVRMVEVDLDEYLGDDCSLVEAVRKRRAKRREKTKKEDKAKTKSEMVDQSSWNTFTTKSVPDWVAPVGVKDHQTSGPMNHSSSAEALVSVDLSGGSQRPIESDGQPSGSRTVWGTYIPSNATSSGAPADQVHDPDDIWASHQVHLGLNRARAGVRAELNTEDLDDSDDDQEGGEGSKKKGGPRKKGKQKNRKHVNKVVINLSGGTGGRRF